jgi:uncharacterized protein
MRRDEALNLLKDAGTAQDVAEHCLAVSALASEMAEKIRARGHGIDVGFVETAAILHDIGRGKTHGIAHGIEGAKILKAYPAYARVCECHIGGGIEKREAERLGLPPKDYLPKTLEEKVVCYADKLMHGTRKATLEETVRKFEGRLGEGHPTISRIRRLEREMRGLMGE